jgi:hypothetical protein
MDVQNTDPVPASQLDLQSQYNRLQQLVSSLLLIMIVISGTLSIFLWRQYRFVNSELGVLAPQATQLAIEQTNYTAFVQDVARKLAEYSRTHPDFAPIAARYHLNDSAAKPGTTAITSSLPASASPAKK